MLAAEGQNAQGLDTLEQALQQAVTNINQSLAKIQDTLTAGNGISIEKKGEELVISTNISFGIYEIETALPPIEEAKLNVIYLVPNSSTSSSSENDILDEYIKIPNPNSGDPYIWERLGHITAGTDISGLVTRVETLE
jgi:hypothetical protein